MLNTYNLWDHASMSYRPIPCFLFSLVHAIFT
jgi:hypothetical protein